MRELLILRHGKSSWKFPHLDDHDRPLKKRGLRDGPRMGQLIQQLGFVPDLILSSTAVRATHTARLAAEACSFQGELIRTTALFHANPPQIVHTIGELAGDHARVMVVAHNPGLETLVHGLTGCHEVFPTAALAVVRAPTDHWRALQLRHGNALVGLWRPKEL